MSDKACRRLHSPIGQRLYTELLQGIEREGMRPLLQKGALVALSGGADSVLLLTLLVECRARAFDFPLYAMHVHHGIRAGEADRDADFCRSLCDTLGVPLTVVFCDAPAFAEQHGLGLEEAARELRYAALRENLKKMNASYIVTAHHATDQLETVLHHMLRGSGLQGLCGMWPIGEDVLRPMLSMTAEDIRSCLREEKITHMSDSTNDSDAYMRNYIRMHVLPTLTHITPSPERAITRMTRNLRADASYINRMAETFFRSTGDEIPCDALLSLDRAVFARVIFLMTAAHSPIHSEEVHVEQIRSLLSDGKAFSVSLPGGLVFASDGKNARIDKINEGRKSFSVTEEEYPLHEGMNDFPRFGFSVYVSRQKMTDISLNVYKFSIQASLCSAIINGALRLRFRRRGDAYRFGGVTHKVKRLFCDRHIGHADRGAIPILCDDSGIVWIPGFGVRQDGERQSEGVYVTFLAHGTFPISENGLIQKGKG